MKVGCLNKNTNLTDYTYVSNRVKSLAAPYGKDPYVQYEIEEGNTADMYIWDEATQAVIVDPNYVAPTPDLNLLGMRIVSQAIEFGNTLIIEFAGENVALGITQSGKTKDVADYLADITRYCQTGSLYEVANEIDRIISEGIPSELDPFVNQTRLTEFKSKIMSYLS